MSIDEAIGVREGHFVSEPSVSSCSTWLSLGDAARTSTPSSVAKPTVFALETDKQASQPNKYKKLDFASEPSALNFSKQTSSHDALRTPTPSSAAKPVAQQISPPLLCMMQKLNKMESRDACIQNLLSEMRILQHFKQMCKPTNRERWGVL